MSLSLKSRQSQTEGKVAADEKYRREKEGERKALCRLEAESAMCHDHMQACKTHCDFNPNLAPPDEEVEIEKGNEVGGCGCAFDELIFINLVMWCLSNSKACISI